MDEDKIVGFSVPDLRNVTMLEFTDVDWIFDRLVGLNGDIFEISYGVEWNSFQITFIYIFRSHPHLIIN